MSEQDAINRIKNIKLIKQTDYEANSECIDDLIDVFEGLDIMKLSSGRGLSYTTISENDAPKLFKHGYANLCYACAWFNLHSDDFFAQYQSDQRDGAWIHFRKRDTNMGSNLR